jgi:cytochrome c556
VPIEQVFLASSAINMERPFMLLNKISAFAMAGLLSMTIVAGGFAQDAGTPDPAIASMAPDAKIAARQAAMQEDGKVLKGAGTLTGDEAIAAAQTLVTNFTNFPALFAEGTEGGKSKALPAVWENWDTFVGIFAKARTQAVAALTAAQAGDMAGYQAALQPIGQFCGECHQQFRGK